MKPMMIRKMVCVCVNGLSSIAVYSSTNERHQPRREIPTLRILKKKSADPREPKKVPILVAPGRAYIAYAVMCVCVCVCVCVFVLEVSPITAYKKWGVNRRRCSFTLSNVSIYCARED